MRDIYILKKSKTAAAERWLIDGAMIKGERDGGRKKMTGVLGRISIDGDKMKKQCDWMNTCSRSAERLRGDWTLEMAAEG